MKVFRDFAQISTDFKGFCSDFHQINPFGVYFTPCLLHQWLSPINYI